MNICVVHNHHLTVASGDGIAFTVFKDHSSTLCSLMAVRTIGNAQLERKVWLDSVPIKEGDELRVFVTDEHEPTIPAQVHIEPAARNSPPA